MAQIFSYTLLLLCGAGLTVTVFALDSFLRHLPNIFIFLLNRLTIVNRYLYRFYRAIYSRLWVWSRHGPTSQLARTLVTSLLSAGLAFLFTQLIGLRVNPWWYALPFLHGAYIGWTWNALDLPQGIWMGTRR